MASAAADRIDTAIRLDKPDRVPVVPLIDIFAARYGGITQHEMFFNMRKSDLALEKTVRELGPIDGQSLSYGGMGPILKIIFLIPPLLPGVDGVPDDALWQFDERAVMQVEDYDKIREMGFIRWLMMKERVAHPEKSFLAQAWPVPFAGLKILASIMKWRRRGVEQLVGFNLAFTPMEFASMALRSYTELTLDMYRRPDDVKDMSRALMRVFKAMALIFPQMSRIKRVFMGGARTSSACINRKQFETFALPEWLEMSEFLVRHGLTPLLHMDSDWTEFLPYFLELPARKCILNLDGTTDIFKAKELLGDHMCLMGDVPATLLKLGSPDEVDAYCERLIKEVGRDGGFILSSGCTIPIDAKPENVKAMIQSVQRYKP